jgi:hypothetical protein
MFVLFAIYAEELIDYRAAPVAIAAIYFLMLVPMAGAEIQLVTIDGPVVCVRNAASTLRRRVFNVAEVARIEYSDGRPRSEQAAAAFHAGSACQGIAAGVEGFHEAPRGSQETSAESAWQNHALTVGLS